MHLRARIRGSVFVRQILRHLCAFVHMDPGCGVCASDFGAFVCVCAQESEKRGLCVRFWGICVHLCAFVRMDQ